MAARASCSRSDVGAQAVEGAGGTRAVWSAISIEVRDQDQAAAAAGREAPDGTAECPVVWVP
jgi:hypothetical protein